MGAEEPEIAADAGIRAAEFVAPGTPGAGVEQTTQVAVAETGLGEFAARDGIEQDQVIKVAESQGAEAMAAVADRTGNGVEEPGAGGGVGVRRVA
jgi:hypothetical protein